MATELGKVDVMVRVLLLACAKKCSDGGRGSAMEKESFETSSPDEDVSVASITDSCHSSSVL